MGAVTANRPGQVWGIDVSGWRRRLAEYRRTLGLLMRSPPAAIGLVIVLVYLGILVYDQFFVPGNDLMKTNFDDPFPRAPFWWPGGTPQGGWLGTTKSGIDLGDAPIKAIRIELLYSSLVVLFGAMVGS